jgi:hypothetical protein
MVSVPLFNSVYDVAPYHLVAWFSEEEEQETVCVEESDGGDSSSDFQPEESETEPESEYEESSEEEEAEILREPKKRGNPSKASRPKKMQRIEVAQPKFREGEYVIESTDDQTFQAWEIFEIDDQDLTVFLHHLTRPRDIFSPVNPEREELEIFHVNRFMGGSGSMPLNHDGTLPIQMQV